jgi:hypothetical protein
MFSAGVVAARIWVLRRSGELEAAEGGSPLAVLDAIDMRLMELHGVSGRLTELEERVDFSERLLAQGRAGDQEVPRA